MKLLITSVPWTDTESPLLAPALLKSMCVNKGIDTVAIDLNQEVLHFVKSNFAQRYHDIENACLQNHNLIQPQETKSIIEFMEKRIMQYNPTHVALSLLTYGSQFICEWLCFHLKLKHPELHIIIGGPGVFNTLETEQGFGDKLLEQGQIDFYVKGDGDEMLSRLLTEDNSSLAGVNNHNWQQLETLNHKPHPMYDDYRWYLYANQSVAIVGSRGCVRRCTFCDIHQHWKKFQWRSAEDIFDEMVYQNKQTGATKFKFQDSLINGNQNEFMKLVRLLSKHNLENPNNQFKWSSMFIFRPKNQMQDEDWELIGHSASIVIVGVESFVDRVRMHMRKKFTNEDLDYCLAKCKQFGITVGVMLIVGYITDTEETHQETLEWFENNKHYANDPVAYMNFGGGLGILPGTELYTRREEFGIILNDVNFDHQWVSADGKNTHDVRMRWMHEQKEACKKAGFVVQDNIPGHLIMELGMK